MSALRPRHALPLALAMLACARTAEPTTSDSNAPGRERPSATAITPEPLPRELDGNVALMPRALTSFGAARHGEHVYVYGGYFGRPHQYSREGQSGILYRLELATGAWEQLGRGPELQSVAMVSHAGMLYRVGGMAAVNPASEPADLRSSAGFARFDPSTLRWTELPALPEPRSSHDAIVVGGSLYVVGGWTLAGDPHATTWLDGGVRYDLDREGAAWERIDMPFARRAVAAAAVGGVLAVVGGIDSEGKTSRSLDLFDPATGRWTRGPDFPGAGFGVAAVGMGDVLYAGGSDGAIHRWRKGDAAWQRETSMALPRFFHRYVATGDGEIAVLGGIRSMATGTRVRVVERLAVGDALRPPSITHAELASPLPSKNRQGVLLLEDQLYLFGGNTSLGQHDFGPEHFTDQGASLDLATLAWTPSAPYPARRQTMSTLVAADGTAQAMIPPGAQVSAIRLPTDTATTLDAQVTTITGVRPGDALVFGLRAAPAPTTVGGQTTMSASFSPATGASRYNFFTPCGLSIATATPATLTFRDGCHGAAFDLLATTVAAGVPMFLKVAAVNYQSGGALSWDD